MSLFTEEKKKKNKDTYLDYQHVPEDRPVKEVQEPDLKHDNIVRRVGVLLDALLEQKINET